MVKVKVTGSPAFTAAGTVVISSEYSRVSNGSPGTSVMPHLRQRLPGSLAVTSGCIGQNHAVVPGGAELCCAAAPSVSSTTSSSASLFRRIVIQSKCEPRTRRVRAAPGLVRAALGVRDRLQHGACWQCHGFLEHVWRRPHLMRVL